MESTSSKKSKGGYISKKRALEIERQRTSEIEDQKRKRDKRLTEEDDYGWSNHIIQLQHMADICEDFNYIVDMLEDEHQRRTVHTTIELPGENDDSAGASD